MHPFLFGKDPQTIAGIDTANGGDLGFFGTGSYSDWKPDYQWNITPLSLREHREYKE